MYVALDHVGFNEHNSKNGFKEIFFKFKMIWKKKDKSLLNNDELINKLLGNSFDFQNHLIKFFIYFHLYISLNQINKISLNQIKKENSN